MATKKKKRKTEDENREFKVEWTETFAFIRNLNGLPTCLICNEKFAHNKKSNLERHFTAKHASFSSKYPVGDARKEAVKELLKSQETSTSKLNNWMQSSSNIDMASFVVSQEIAKRGKPYTDGEYIKSCFISASEELFRDFKNKADILKKIKELPLSAKTIKERTIKMSSNITVQQIEVLKMVPALPIAVESCDINDSLFSDAESDPASDSSNHVYNNTITISETPLLINKAEPESPPESRPVSPTPNQNSDITFQNPTSADTDMECDVEGKRIAIQLKAMNETQRLLAEKIISEVMYWGRIGKLEHDSFQYKPSLKPSCSSANISIKRRYSSDEEQIS